MISLQLACAILAQHACKNIKNTLIYTHLVKFADKDEYVSKVAHSVEEACELIDKGFEYAGCINGAEIFRTRK